MQLFRQYNIHPYLIETFLDAFHLYQDNIEIVQYPICQQRGFILDK